jgi:hypothetical protein
LSTFLVIFAIPLALRVAVPMESPHTAVASISPPLRLKIKEDVKDDGQEVPHGLSGRKDDFGMEQRAGDASGDGEQVPLSEEDFHLAGAGEFGKVD